MQPIVTIEGTIVAHTSRTFDTFTDDAGRTVQGGTTRRVYLVGAFDSPPAEVKVKDPAIFDSLVGLGQFGTCRLICEGFARRNRLDLTCVAVEEALPFGKKAA